MKVHTMKSLGCLMAALLLLTIGGAAQTADYMIAKGDRLQVTVFGYNEFATTETVRDNGTITIPLLGDIKAAGLTKDEFITNLKKRLAEYIQGDINVTVSVVASLGQRVTVLGAVAKPSNYPISNEINLLELLSMAEGYLPDARLSKIKIFHKDKSLGERGVSTIDLDGYLERAAIDSIPKVLPGDIVFVPKQENAVKEFGEFFRDVAFLLTLFRLTDIAR